MSATADRCATCGETDQDGKHIRLTQGDGWHAFVPAVPAPSSGALLTREEWACQPGHGGALICSNCAEEKIAALRARVAELERVIAEALNVTGADEFAVAAMRSWLKKASVR